MGDAAYDAVVIGSGAGGGFAALGLTEAGFKVLLLERGPRFDPATDYPMVHEDWERHPNSFRIAPDPTVEPHIGPPLDPARIDLLSRNGPAPPSRARENRGLFYYRRVLGVGGTTLHYQGEAHRFADYAFRAASAYGHGVDWPIGYRELEPYYERAERILGVAGEPGNPHKPPRGSFPTPAQSLSRASRLIGAAARKLGWTLRTNTLALPSLSVDGRPPCQHSGGCTTGCIFNAKSSVDQTAIRLAERTGRLTLRTRARAVALETDARGSVSGVVYLHGGARRLARARVYVLALGAIETPRLLLLSDANRHPQGIGNHSGQLGRNLMENVSVNLVVRFAQPLQAYKGPPIDARIWDFAHPDPQGSVQSGCVLGVSGTSSGFHGPVSYALATTGFGLAHKRAVRNRFGSVVSIFGVAEQEPRAENRVALTERLDADGIPMVRVHSGHSAKDVAALSAMIARCTRLAKTAGAEQTIAMRSSYDRVSATHVAGTCRMGRDPDMSVVGPHGQVHGADNLYIADASVLVTQGAGDSPSLTIQALALRTAAFIAQRLRT